MADGRRSETEDGRWSIYQYDKSDGEHVAEKVRSSRKVTADKSKELGEMQEKRKRA